MNSVIYEGEMMHCRIKPVRHEFRYPVYFLGLDLDELDAIGKANPLFGYNRRRIFSIRDRDYFPGMEGPIKNRLQTFLRQHGYDSYDAAIARVELLTSPRYFGVAFNPINIYRCFDQHGLLRLLVAEVNNTFGETHIYILPSTQSGREQKYLHFQASKEFHVSPFNDRQGQYQFHALNSKNGHVDVKINLARDGDVVFLSSISGVAKPLTLRNVIQTMTTYPFSGFLALVRIWLQAAQLFFAKKLRVYSKPIADSDFTIRRSDPSILQRLCKSFVCRHLAKLTAGELRIHVPGMAEMKFGGDAPGASAGMHVRNYNFFVRSVVSGDVGFGEAFVRGDWDSPDPTAVVQTFIENREYFDDRNLLVTKAGRLANRAVHFLRRNIRHNSRKNISAHYDLGNSFFESFLDPSMLYSSAIFSSERESLEVAQQRKLDLIIDKAQLSAADHVAEIGCGWGGFAIEAAKKTGCRVTGITLSKNQLTFARERAKEAGVDSLVQFELCDYRDFSGKYSKIVSIEMLEAVGHENFGTFFAMCDRILSRNGLAVLQVITVPDARYEKYRRGCDWIQKYIFPGGHCPSLTAIAQAMTKSSKFYLESVENYGPHYATTLRKWRERYEARRLALRSLGFDETFERMWRYYLCYCEAAFNARALNNLQLIFSREQNKSLSSVPSR